MANLANLSGNSLGFELNRKIAPRRLNAAQIFVDVQSKSTGWLLQPIHLPKNRLGNIATVEVD